MTTTPTRRDVNRKLEDLRGEVEREAKARKRRRGRGPRRLRLPRDPQAVARRAALVTAKALAVVVFPFVVLVRVAVSAYTEGHPTWLALTAAASVAVGVVTLYAAWVSEKLTGRARLADLAKKVALPLVAAYTLYALLYVSAANAKTDEVRAEYLRLHPILRLAVGTVMLADRDLLITDMARRSADYPRMGLKVFERSRHLRQADGFSHALDIRTEGRGEIRNRLTQLYFVAMGFETLRHGGTGDHLHVELRRR
jgi:hypothetical protein